MRPTGRHLVTPLAPPKSRRARAARKLSRKRGGFTLIECLITLLLMAVVLPTIMGGVTTITRTASDSRRYSDAAQLAASKLSELLMSPGSLSVGTQSGDFSDQQYPDYQWKADISAWQPSQANANAVNAQIYQVDLTVTWSSGTGQRNFVLSSLAYPNSNPPSPYNNSSGTSAAPSGGGGTGGSGRGNGGGNGGGSGNGSGNGAKGGAGKGGR